MGREDWDPRPDQAEWAEAEVERKHNEEGEGSEDRRGRAVQRSAGKLIVSWLGGKYGWFSWDVVSWGGGLPADHEAGSDFGPGLVSPS